MNRTTGCTPYLTIAKRPSSVDPDAREPRGALAVGARIIALFTVISVAPEEHVK